MDSKTMSWFYEWFWSERFWLPVGYSWKDLQTTDKVNKAELKELCTIPFFVIIVSICRYCFERLLARPFCLYIGIKDEPEAKDHKICDNFYSNCTKYPCTKEILKLVGETGMTKHQLSAWFRKRRQRNKYRLMKKATESCYRCICYLALFCYGSFVLLKTDWFWDNSKWLKGYIREHPFTTDMKVYYFVEMSFYFALLASHCFDTKRKDFYQHFIHHIATLALLLGSYTVSLYRFGAVILYLHDAADFWLEAAKVANYAKIQKVCDALFAVFGIVFICTRIIYYPVWIAHGYFNYNTNTNGCFHNILVFLCFLLLFLNLYWGFLIASMAYKLVVVGKVEKDTRSDTEESDNEERSK